LESEEEMPTGWADYTYPVTIAAQTIPQLDVNISAQTLDALSIKIVGQSLPVEITNPTGESLDVAITSSVTLDVNIANTPVEITNPTGENLNVAIQSSVALDVNITNTPVEITNPAGENLNVAVQSSVTLNTNITNTPIEITNPTGENLNVAVQSSVTLNTNIANMPVEITNPTGESLDVAITSSVALNVNVTNTPIEITNPTGENLNVAVQSSVTLDVNITNTPIEITNPSGQNLNVAIQSSTELNVNVTNPTIEVTNPEGTPMEVSITTSVTLNVHIESADTFTVNIQTSAGANIVIDKLTTTAYTEERRNIGNNGGTPTMFAVGVSTFRGKFFPRGMRGFIDRIKIWCDNSDSASHSLYIYVAPQPGMGRVFDASIVVSAGAAGDWRSALIRRFWNYDSMFIYILADNANYPRVGYDEGTPYDAYFSSDEATWTTDNKRFWIRVEMTGETVGDLPVSGTVNTVQVPSASTYVDSGIKTVGAGVTATLATVNGAGNSMWILCWSSNEYMTFEVYVDGELQLYFAPYDLHSHFCDVGNGVGVSLTMWDTTNGNYAFMVTIPFPFRRKIEVKAYNDTSSSYSARAYIVASKI